MANIPMKTIKLPGLSDTYTFLQESDVRATAKDVTNTLIGYRPVGELEQINGNYNTSGVWNNINDNYKHILISIAPGDVIKMVAGSEQLNYGILAQPTTPTNNQAADDAPIAGYTGVKSIAAGNSVEIEAPATATTLLIMSTYNGVVRDDYSLWINGLDYTKNVAENLGAGDEMARKGVNDTLDYLSLISSKHSNLLDLAQETVVYNVTHAYVDGVYSMAAINANEYSNVQHKSIPVDGFDKVTVVFDNKENAVIRIGGKTGNTESWLSTIGTSPMTFDVSQYDTIKIALYVHGITKDVSAGEEASISGLFVVAGEMPVYYPGATAIDYTARQKINEFYHDGNASYYGDKIVLSGEDNVYRCSRLTWKNFTIAEIPELGDYELWRNQSMAIYNGLVFLAKANNTITIMDYATKGFVGDYTLPGGSHANSAQFTDIFFDASDTFPLLLISKCGNSNATSGVTSGSDDAALFYRVRADGTGYTFTLVHSLILDVGSFGSSWYYDAFIHRIICAYFKNGNYSVAENNPMLISTFDVPNVLSGAETTLTESDAINMVRLPHVTFQGGFAENGLIYMGLQDLYHDQGSSLWVIEASSGRLLSRMKLVSNKECEGLCQYDGKIYTSQRSGGDTENVNPLIIDEYTF